MKTDMEQMLALIIEAYEADLGARSGDCEAALEKAAFLAYELIGQEPPPVWNGEAYEKRVLR